MEIKNYCPVCGVELPRPPGPGRKPDACIECRDYQNDVARVLRSLAAVLATGRNPGNVEAHWIAYVGAEVPVMFSDALRRANPAEVKAARLARRKAAKG